MVERYLLKAIQKQEPLLRFHFLCQIVVSLKHLSIIENEYIFANIGSVDGYGGSSFGILQL